MCELHYTFNVVLMHLVTMYFVFTGPVQIIATSNHVLTSTKTWLITDETLHLAF